MFGSDQEVSELMKAVGRANISGYFTWIGSDGWGGRSLVSDGNELQVCNLRNDIVFSVMDDWYL